MTNDKQQLTIRGRSFNWGERTYLMGVLNVTPDSFSDGGEFNEPAAALAHAQLLVEAGVDIIDIGGQSTRPGAEQISVEEELERVLSVLKAIRSVVSVPISVDTTRAFVAQETVAAGADFVNDISGGMFDPDMLSIVAQLGVPIVLMHSRGTPQTMQNLTDYQDLIGEIYEFLERQITAAVQAGIERSHLMIDPGIGFAKTAEQNLEIIRQLSAFDSLGVPLVVGVSRKSFIGRILNQPEPKRRVWGTAAACCGAIATGADILRVHDVLEMQDVCRVADAIWR
ncbi:MULTISPECIES: dihydropteroate synthase [unclassified Coleofasciculus]|uniref:dihydropteroate synthase n=1 Tax=unclassified Coleofasciculus TaxID=2692782 RepID=UPI00187EEE64|nr:MULTISPECIES: dihydropteroate synthase [unclassified Coleofasciculus]MBE9127866.1 dihydropteroate synthase [Coleofasciculus sp. LEGE 07081]MBE9149638.1 dihydropteroate synthase [Coleofasciculus sp. LEGE 07092]